MRREIALGKITLRKARLLVAAGWITGSLVRGLIVALITLAALIIWLGLTVRGRRIHRRAVLPLIHTASTLGRQLLRRETLHRRRWLHRSAGSSAESATAQ